MKNVMKICLLAIICLTFGACDQEEKNTYYFSISNGMQLSTNNLKIMQYAESKVQMGGESLMTYTGTQTEAETAAKNEFAKRLEAINETEFCAMIATGDYYEFILYRLAIEGKSEAQTIDSKRYTGK